MNQQMREQLFDVLMGQMPPVTAVVEMVTEDIDSIVPLIDGWLLEAHERGRFQGILETLPEVMCAPAPANVVCHVCKSPAQFITYKKAHCFEHRPTVA